MSKKKNYGKLKAVFNIRMKVEEDLRETDEIDRTTHLVLSSTPSTGVYQDSIRLKIGEEGQEYIVDIIHLRNAIDGLFGCYKVNGY